MAFKIADLTKLEGVHKIQSFANLGLTIVLLDDEGNIVSYVRNAYRSGIFFISVEDPQEAELPKLYVSVTSAKKMVAKLNADSYMISTRCGLGVKEGKAALAWWSNDDTYFNPPDGGVKKSNTLDKYIALGGSQFPGSPRS